MVNLQSYSDYLAISIEIWLPLKGFEFPYEISTWGAIRCPKRDKKQGRYNWKSFLLNQHISTTGYYNVKLRLNGKAVNRKVHRLICITFKNNPLNKKEVNHLDGNPLNIKFNNLEWATHSENIQHSYDVLKRPVNIKAAKLAWEKINESQVREIRSLILQGASLKNISIIYKTHESTISAIKNNRNWS